MRIEFKWLLVLALALAPALVASGVRAQAEAGDSITVVGSRLG